MISRYIEQFGIESFDRMSDLAQSIIEYKKSLSDNHFAGDLSVDAFERIEWYLANYFVGKTIRSIETGCGSTTILFSNFSTKHTVYADNNTSENPSLKAVIVGCPLCKPETIEWFFGPTEKTLVDLDTLDDVDIILLNGRHGFPIPDFEYHNLIRSLKVGGMLILSGVDIPTVKNLFDFISQERGIRTHGLSSTTAFFQRFDTTYVEPKKYEWWLQAYNAQNYPAITNTALNVGLTLPVKLEFGGNLNGNNSNLTRGFSFQNGYPVTEGYDSKINVKLAEKISGQLRIDISIKPICVEERSQIAGAAGTQVHINGVLNVENSFENSQPQKLEISYQAVDCDLLEIEIWHLGLVGAWRLATFEKLNGFDARLPNHYLYSVEIAAVDMKPSNSVARLDGSIVSFDYDQHKFFFFVHQENDSVQSFHANGRFYEIEELEAIRSHVATGGRILEVGAHMGNHTVFFATFLNPTAIVVMEPNPSTREILKMNLRLNQIQCVDTSRAHFALGAEHATGKLRVADKYNTGGMAIELASDGAIEIVAGDELFPNEDFDFIKVDVEGLELEVLQGLQQLIMRCRPLIFVEVTAENQDGFLAFVDTINYRIKWRHEMYVGLTNFILEQNPDALPPLNSPIEN
jgi:FkbM family methyltransferase